MGSCIPLRRVSSFYQSLPLSSFIKRLTMLSLRGMVLEARVPILRSFYKASLHVPLYSEKGLKILNLEASQTTNSVAAVLEDAADDAVDPHLERIKNAVGGEESDEEDEDFVIEKDDGGSPTDDSGGEESDASDSGAEKEKPAKKETKKEAAPAKAQSSKKRSKDGDEESSKKKRPKKKKDPNAPKRAMSGFMFFSNSERE